MLREDTFVVGDKQAEKDKIADMIAFSHGLLRSVRLSVYEQEAEVVVMDMKEIMDTVYSTGKISAGKEDLSLALSLALERALALALPLSLALSLSRSLSLS